MENPQKRKLALITGASDGIGYELAKIFATNGYDLIVAAEDPGIAEAAQAFRALGVNVDHLMVDLAKHAGVVELYAKVHSLGRPLDVAALNAGVGVNGDFVRETKLEDELNLIHLNVISTVHLAKLVLRDMVARDDGKVLFTSSIAATIPGAFSACYNASKAFVQSFSQAIRNELKDTKVTITALQPGPTDTNFFNRAGMQDTKVGAGEKDSAAGVAKDGFDALMAGKDHVIGGSLKNKAQVVAGKVIPETTKAEMHRKQAEPGSANK